MFLKMYLISNYEQNCDSRNILNVNKSLIVYDFFQSIFGHILAFAHISIHILPFIFI